MTRRKADITRGSGNVFADLGLDEAEDLSMKSAVAMQVNEIIAERGLKQAEAAKLLGIAQPKVSALRHGRLHGFSLEMLLTFMLRLDRDVEIAFRKKDNANRSRVVVKAGRKRLEIDAIEQAGASMRENRRALRKLAG